MSKQTGKHSDNSELKVGITNDLIFKSVFGSNESEAELIDLINSVLENAGFAPVTYVALKNPVSLGETYYLKKTEVDILAKTEDGTQYDVEIQIGDDATFAKRSLFYLRKIYVQQLKKKELYETLKPVIGINFVKKTMRPKNSPFHNWYLMTNPNDPKDILDTDIIVHYIELDKVTDQQGKLADWVRLFKTVTGNESEQEIKTLVQRSTAMREAYKRFKNCTKEEALMLYALSKEKYLMATKGREQYFQMQLEKGRKELEVGQKELEVAQQELQAQEQELQAQQQEIASEKQELASEKQELASEKQELASEKQELARRKNDLEKKATEIINNNSLATAKNLLAMGLSVEQITQATGLSVEQIKAIHIS